MAPRAGGEADKFGNRYEGAWTVRHVLEILAGAGTSITVEDFGDLGDGVEFTYHRKGSVEVHQVKRQHGSANSWTVLALQAEGVWTRAKRHVEAQRAYHFVSTIPAQVPSQLSDHARRSSSLTEFTQKWLTNSDLRAEFERIASERVLGSEQVAWGTLRGMYFRCADELEVTGGNAALAALLLDGASGALCATGVADLIANKLGVTLTEASITAGLKPYGLNRVTATRTAALIARVADETSAWSDAVKITMLRPFLERAEVDDLVRAVSASSEGVVLLAGHAGGGKTAVLQQAVDTWRDRGLPVLAFRLDRVENFSTTDELGARIGLGASPVAALATSAVGSESVLVIDQLDAVSFASGRSLRSFDVVAELVREASAFPSMRVVLSCRKFDVENDDRIRALASRSTTSIVEVGALGDAQIDQAVSSMGLSPTSLTAQQRALLRIPLHLVLLAATANQAESLRFQTSVELLDAFWDRKRRDVVRRRPGTRFAATVFAAAEHMSKIQRLFAPGSVFDQDGLDDDAAALISENVLVREGRHVAFFHEAFFDYAFARKWTAGSETIVEFLTAGEQELFRRAQVRQIMTHLREIDPQRFLTEVDDLLTSKAIRVHIKVAALAVIGHLSEPTSAECELVLRVAAAQPALAPRLWRHLRTPDWFARLDGDGHLVQIIARGGEESSRALTLISDAVVWRPERAITLLREHGQERIEPFTVRTGLNSADPEVRRSVFEVFLDAVRAGGYDNIESLMWAAIHDLPDEHPEWAVEFLTAHLVDRPDALAVNEDGRVAGLEAGGTERGRFASRAAEGAPQHFVEALLPYMLDVMAVTSHEPRGPGLRRDRHFSYRLPAPLPRLTLSDGLLTGMASALATLAATQPATLETALDRLVADKHDGAQWLLYNAMCAGGAAYAEKAAGILLQGPERLLSGYVSNGVWMTRELLQAITPHVSDEYFARLEDVLRDVRFGWERRNPGWYAFNLLTGLSESRLSDAGRRRLGEMRRVYGHEQPPEPEGITGGSVDSPIAPAAAARMSDENWLRAIAKHSEEREDPRLFVGGARELSSVLSMEAKRDPGRFARLAQCLPLGVHPAYCDAILRGLGEADVQRSDEADLYQAVRHIAAHGYPDADRWLGWALQHASARAPLDVAELIKDRLLTTTDPSDDGARIWSDDVVQIESSGINTARGALAEAMAVLIAHDTDGQRTTLIEPHLERLASDPSTPVRACVATLIGAASRHARSSAISAFWRLIEGDDALLTTGRVMQLLVYFGGDDPTSIVPVVDRMLAATAPDVRYAGGQLATYAALEWGQTAQLDRVLSCVDSDARRGAANVAAIRLTSTAHSARARAVVTMLADDDDPGVRTEAATAASTLRDHALGPYTEVLTELMRSRAFAEVSSQLLITLERAPDNVASLSLSFASRFVEVFGGDAADMRTRAAGDVADVATLLVRGVTQASSAAERSALLDSVDSLLLTGAYGIDDVVDSAGR